MNEIVFLNLIDANISNLFFFFLNLGRRVTLMIYACYIKGVTLGF